MFIGGFLSAVQKKMPWNVLKFPQVGLCDFYASYSAEKLNDMLFPFIDFNSVVFKGFFSNVVWLIFSDIIWIASVVYVSGRLFSFISKEIIISCLLYFLFLPHIIYFHSYLVMIWDGLLHSVLYVVLSDLFFHLRVFYFSRCPL